jgi:hypothetical protein
MPSWPRSLWAVARFVGAGLVTLGCWTAWLLLGLLLLLQVAVAVSGEFQVPRFVLRAFSERFAASHIEARFGRALLDPTGGVLLENLELSLPEFVEPVIQARAVYVELDPWPLLLGRVEARRVHGTGVRVMVPAMLAPSGRTEPGVDDLEFDVTAEGEQLGLRSVTTRIAGVAVAVHGNVRLPKRAATTAKSPVPLLEDVAAHYANYARQVVKVASQLQGLEQPVLQAALTASTHHGALATVTVTAQGLERPDLQQLVARELRLEAQVPLGGVQPALVPFTLTVGDVRTAGGIAAGLTARGHAVMSPGRLYFTPRRVELALDRATARGFTVARAAAELNVAGFPQIDGRVWLEYGGAPLFASGRADVAGRTAVARVTGAVSPELLTPLSTILKRDLRQFVDFGAPVAADLEVRFGPDWKFAGLAGRIAAVRIDAYHVRLDAGGGEITFDGRHFVARHAFATIGPNLARGSFEQDLKTRQFRFLLNGRLRPLDISGWFHSWWPHFFEHFDFPDAPPDASVDVAGIWKAGDETTVFLYAQSGQPTIRDAKLDYARTLMFIRPNFFDALEVHGTRGAGEIRGSFTVFRDAEADANEVKKVTFAFTSTLDLPTGAHLLGPRLTERLAPFSFQHPPQLSARGEIESQPAAPDHWRHAMEITARSAGEFTAYGLPGRDLNFAAKVSSDEVTLDRFAAGLAGGQVSGHARVWGAAPERRLGFDVYVKDASLREAIDVASTYVASRHGKKQGSAEQFLSDRNTARLDLAVSAEGLLASPTSFRGSGNASIAGGELGEIRLLGLLSQLLNFTALRFTAARAEFKLEGPKIVFPSVNVTGANSAIHAHGDYSIERHALDFNARVYPFEESKGLLQSIVGAVLTPFSAALEVRLTGALTEPKWAFVIGPTNLFNSLSGPESPAPTAEPRASPPPDAPPAPANKTN